MSTIMTSTQGPVFLPLEELCMTPIDDRYSRLNPWFNLFQIPPLAFWRPSVQPASVASKTTTVAAPTNPYPQFGAFDPPNYSPVALAPTYCTPNTTVVDYAQKAQVEVDAHQNRKAHDKPFSLWPWDAQKLRAEVLIVDGDFIKGNQLLDTPIEIDMLRHWIRGSGAEYELNDQDMTMVQNHEFSLAVGQKIAAGNLCEVPIVIGDKTQIEWDVPGRGRYPVTLTSVILENGLTGYQASMNFNFESQRDDQRTLDGSMGRADVFFDQEGKVVGVVDTYDFSNDSLNVDTINFIGAQAGAKNFRVVGGTMTVEARHKEVPPMPGLLESGGDGAQKLWNGIWDRVA
jgi:hypothetical protein